MLVELSHAQVPLLLRQLRTAVRRLVRLLGFVCERHRRTETQPGRPRSPGKRTPSRSEPTAAGHGGAHPVAACAHAAVALHLGLGSVLVGLVLQGALCRGGGWAGG